MPAESIESPKYRVGMPVKAYHIGVGCVLILPPIKTLKAAKKDGEPDYENIPCGTLKGCSKNCKLHRNGFGHPFIVLDMIPRPPPQGTYLLVVQMSSTYPNDNTKSPFVRNTTKTTFYHPKFLTHQKGRYRLESGMLDVASHIVLHHIFELPLRIFQTYGTEKEAKACEYRLDEASYNLLLERLNLKISPGFNPTSASDGIVNHFPLLHRRSRIRTISKLRNLVIVARKISGKDSLTAKKTKQQLTTVNFRGLKPNESGE